MKTIVLCDSFFGNTEKVAQSIGKVLGAKMVRIADSKPGDLPGVELLIVGSPTRAFRPSPATTEFINKLPANALKDVKVTAFDTRIDPKDIKSSGARTVLGFFISLFGYAAKPIAKKLVGKGGKLIVEPEGFYVTDTKGPLRDGELERAKAWAEKIEVKISKNTHA
ncbi:MAG TPA: nitric oxide synthase [bacterium]|nr:nitric oxide synthase [bacterium]